MPSGLGERIAGIYDCIAASEGPGRFRGQFVEHGMLEWMLIVADGMRDSSRAIRRTAKNDAVNGEDIVVLIANLIEGMKKWKT